MTREELNKGKQQEIEKEKSREKRKKIIIKILKIILLVTLLFVLFFLYNTYISTGSFIVKEKRIVNEKIPDSFNGTKIVHFSDLHYGSNINQSKLKEIVKMINDREPDIVVFTGDLIKDKYELSNKEQEKLISELKKIDASLGKYAVMGDDDGENYTTIMNQSDFTILNNDYDLIYNNTNDSILLSGFGSYINDDVKVKDGLRYFSEDGANTNIYSIAIFHEPDTADDVLEEHEVDLLLAGHSHNGDIRIPYLGTFIKRNGAKEYHQAHYKINNSELYISSGLGTLNDGIRLFCRPSINFFRLSNS